MWFPWQLTTEHTQCPPIPYTMKLGAIKSRTYKKEFERDGERVREKEGERERERERESVRIHYYTTRGSTLITIDSLSISLGMGLSITLKAGVEQLRWLVVGGRSSASSQSTCG